MIAVRSYAVAAFESVAQNTTTRARAGRTHPETAPIQGLIQLLLRYSRFDDRVGEFPVDLMNSIHPAQINDNILVPNGVCRPVAPVISGRDRVELHTKPVGYGHYASDLFNGVWPHHCHDVALYGNSGATKTLDAFR